MIEKEGAPSIKMTRQSPLCGDPTIAAETETIHELLSTVRLDNKRTQFNQQKYQLEKMSAIQLPKEVWSKIFSYLDKKEQIAASEVCWKLNAASKNPLLWRMLKISFGTLNQFRSFCRFFKQVPYLKELSIDFKFMKEQTQINESDVNRLNDLLESLQQLRCLDAGSNRCPPAILPDNLTHFSYENNCDNIVSQLKSLSTSPIMLQHLSLHLLMIECKEMSDDLWKLLNFLLSKYRSSLLSLSLDFYIYSHKLLPTIVNCVNLKELWFGYVKLTDIEKNDMSGISKLPCHEILHINFATFDKCFSSTFNVKGFPKLHHLQISLGLEGDISDRNYDLLNNIPYLKTFLIEDFGIHVFTEYTSFYNFIKNCKSLENVGVRYVPITDLFLSHLNLHKSQVIRFLKKMIELQKNVQYKSVCLCAFMFDSHFLSSYSVQKIKDNFSCSVCIFSRNDRYNCSHWKGKRGLMDLSILNLNYSGQNDIECEWNEETESNS